MVFLSVLITSSSNIANETVIATIPQGYRPSIARAVNMLDYNNDKPLSSELNTSGSVRVYYGGQSQTKKLYFSDAYVVE